MANTAATVLNKRPTARAVEKTTSYLSRIYMKTTKKQ